MSNILIIKHGSLGDLIQANGAILDIKNSFKNSKVLLLTSNNFVDLMSKCPYIDGVITDKRLPRWNLIYLFDLKKLLKRYNFTHVFDLQNSSRTKFYRKFLLPEAVWSSTETTLEPGETKESFDKDPVLDRMEIQLKKSGIKTQNVKQIDLSWAFVNMDRLIKQYTNDEFFLIFPFCSRKHIKKKWPYYKELIKKIKMTYKNKYTILVAPGPNEIEESKEFNAKVVLHNNNPIDLTQLITLVAKSKFVITNDTGPAHICSHLKKKGLVLFGSHTTAKQVSIETEEFKAISVKDLSELKVDTVLSEIERNLN